MFRVHEQLPVPTKVSLKGRISRSPMSTYFHCGSDRASLRKIHDSVLFTLLFCKPGSSMREQVDFECTRFVSRAAQCSIMRSLLFFNIHPFHEYPHKLQSRNVDVANFKFCFTGTPVRFASRVDYPRTRRENVTGIAARRQETERGGGDGGRTKAKTRAGFRARFSGRFPVRRSCKTRIPSAR